MADRSFWELPKVLNLAAIKVLNLAAISALLGFVIKARVPEGGSRAWSES